MKYPSSLQDLEQWYKVEYESKSQKDIPLDRELVSLIKRAYGIKLCWSFAHFPDLDWFLAPRKKHAGAELLLALIELGELGDHAQSAAPTTKLTASRSCQTEILPCTTAVVEDVHDQYGREETIHINEDLDNTQQLQVTTACGPENNEVEASIAPPRLPGTSSSRTAKRRLVDREDESGSGHSGTDVSGYQTSQYPKAKRVRQTPNAAAEPVPEGFPSPTLPHDGGNRIDVSACEKTGTKTATSDMSSTDKEVVQAQHADGNSSSYPIETTTQYHQLYQTLTVELLHPTLIQDMSQNPSAYLWNLADAFLFIKSAVDLGYIPSVDHVTYTAYKISSNEPRFSELLAMVMPEIQSAGEAAKKVHMVVTLPKAVTSTYSLLIVSAPQL
jgi:hypothetical protein